MLQILPSKNNLVLEINKKWDTKGFVCCLAFSVYLVQNQKLFFVLNTNYQMIWDA